MSSEIHYKIILIGDCRVGKTSFLHSLIKKEGKGNQNHPPTIGVQYAPKTINIRGQNIKINLWDTSGAEKYISVTSSYYRKCQGAILMFDLTNENSFKNLEIWLKELQKTSQQICKIVVGNKMDLVETGEKERKVFEKDIIDFCLLHEVTYKKTSALTGFNVLQSFEELVQNIYDQLQTNTEQEMVSNSYDESFFPSDPENKYPRLDAQDTSCPKCC